MATEICERVRGSQAAELHRGLQPDGGLRPHAEAEGIGRPACTEEELSRRRGSHATDRLLELLKLHHPSHAPLAVLMPKPEAPIENPAPPVAILKADAPSPESAQGPEVGAPPIIPRSPPVIGMAEAVIRAACKHFEIGRETLFSKHKNAVAVRRRFVAIFVARELSTISLHALASKLDLDHSSILHAVRRVTHGMQSEGFAADVNAIRTLALKGKAEVTRPICPHCLQPVAA